MGKVITPTAKHVAFRDATLDLLRKHGADVSAVEMLALAAQIVGQLIALQDRHSLTPTAAMQIVEKNIELGNQHANGKALGPIVGHA